jgi:uncharacterized membrane protein YczE
MQAWELLENNRQILEILVSIFVGLSCLPLFSILLAQVLTKFLSIFIGLYLTLVSISIGISVYLHCPFL